MKTILLNIIAVILGLFIGGFVNTSIINLSGSIIPPPDGIDITTEEGLKMAMHLFKPKHFLLPFLAHAIGTFIGAFITAIIAQTYKRTFALLIGLAFLIGGIMMVFMLHSPVWFALTDLLLAYIPMSLLGYRISKKIKSEFKN